MCRYAPTCRLNCESALNCPQVTAAFGPDKKYPNQERAGRFARRAASWWSKSDGQGNRAKMPKPRVNDKGQKLCSKEGCQEPRCAPYHMCRAHYNEYQRQWRIDNPDRHKAYRDAR